MKKHKKDIFENKDEAFSEHHCDPTSRGGKDEKWNKRKKPIKIHENWHRLFENLKPAEIILIIFSIKFCYELKNLSESDIIKQKILELKNFFARDSIYRLFKNKTLDEVVKNIFIRDRKINSWEVIFGNKTLEEIIEVIEKEWAPLK